MQKPATQGRTIASYFAAPYTFKPDLTGREAILAIAACLARIFGACLLLAAWGGAGVLAWNSLPRGFWRESAVLALLLLFLAALAALMAGIAALERKI